MSNDTFEAKQNKIVSRRQKLIHEIDQMQKEVDRLSDEEERLHKNKLLESTYIQVVCPMCEGLGKKIVSGGNDILSDPVDYSTCDECSGEGFRMARRFNGKEHAPYAMNYNEVYGSV